MINILKNWKLPLLGLVSFIFAIKFVTSREDAVSQGLYEKPPSSKYEHKVAGIGIIEPRNEITEIGIDLPGIVSHVYVKDGDKVRAGDPLILIDERDAAARALVIAGSIGAARAKADEAASRLQRALSLGNSRAVSADELDSRKYGMEIAAAELAKLEAEFELAITTLERLQITTPADGEILEVNVRKGEYAKPAQDAGNPLILMGDTSALHARVEIAQENIKYVIPAAPASGYLRGAPDKEIELKFVRTEPYVRPKQNLSTGGQRVDTRTVRLIYKLEGKEAKSAMIGQQIDVFIESKK